MVGTVEARKLNLSVTCCRPTKVITSLLYESTSLSLALMHSDSSFSLISPFSPFSLSSISPQTLIPPPNSSACFAPLSSNRKLQDCPDEKDVVFVTAGSHNGGSKVVLRFYVLGKGGKFGGVHQVGCSQNGVCFDRKLGGVVLDVSHGMKVMLSGSVNYFAVYSGSAAKVLVFGVRLVGGGGGDGRRELRLVKCAVIECQLPVLSICVSLRFLILGEMKGVRVFPLRALAKGKVGSRRKKSRIAKGKAENSNNQQGEEMVDGKLEGRKLKMPNGVINPMNERNEVGKNVAHVNPSKLLANGYVHNVLDGAHSNGNGDDHHHSTVKPRSLKLRQDSAEWGMQFVSFNGSMDEGAKSREPRCLTIKAISIQAVSPQQFLVLDSNGELHVLHPSKSGPAQMRHLPATIPAQQLAAFSDISPNYRVWVSDGLNSAHVLVISCPDASENESSSDTEEKITRCSVTQAIFTSENIRDMIAVAANAVLLVGKDCLYAYAIS